MTLSYWQLGYAAVLLAIPLGLMAVAVTLLACM